MVDSYVSRARAAVGKQSCQRQNYPHREDETQIVEFLERAISDETPCKSLAVSDGFEALKVTRDMRPNLFVLDYQDLWPKCLLLMESGILHIRLSVCRK